MAKDKRVFTGGMDKDSDPRLIKNGDYRHAENIRNIASSDGTSGSVENIESTYRVNYNFKGEEVDEFIEIDEGVASLIPKDAVFYSQSITFEFLGREEDWANQLENSFTIYTYNENKELIAVGPQWSSNSNLKWSENSFKTTPEHLWEMFNEETGKISKNIPIINLETGEWSTAHSKVDFDKNKKLTSGVKVTVDIISDKKGFPFLLDFSSNGFDGYWSETIDDNPPNGEMNIRGNSNSIVYFPLVLSSQSSFYSENTNPNALDEFLDVSGNAVEDETPISIDSESITEFTLSFSGTEPTSPENVDDVNMFSYAENADGSIEVVPFFSFGSGLFNTNEPYEFNSNQNSISNSLHDQFTDFYGEVLHKGSDQSIRGGISSEAGQVSLSFQKGQKLSQPSSGFEVQQSLSTTENTPNYWSYLNNFYKDQDLGVYSDQDGLSVSGGVISILEAENPTSFKFPVDLKSGNAYMISMETVGSMSVSNSSVELDFSFDGAKEGGYNYSSSDYYESWTPNNSWPYSTSINDQTYRFIIPKGEMVNDVSSISIIVSGGSIIEGDSVSIKFLSVREVKDEVGEFDITFKSSKDFNLCFGNSEEEVLEFLKSGVSRSYLEEFSSGVFSKLTLERKNATDFSYVSDQLFDAEQKIEELNDESNSLSNQLDALKSSYNNTINKINEAIPLDSDLALNKFDSLSNESNILAQELSDISEKIQSTIDQIEDAPSLQLLNEKANLEETVSQLESEKDALQSQIQTNAQEANNNLLSLQSQIQSAIDNVENGLTEESKQGIIDTLGLAGENMILALENQEDGVTAADVKEVQDNLDAIEASILGIKTAFSIDDLTVQNIQSLIDNAVSLVEAEDGVSQSDVDTAVADVQAQLNTVTAQLNSIVPDDGVTQDDVNAVQALLTNANNSFLEAKNQLDNSFSQAQLDASVALVQAELTAARAEIEALKFAAGNYVTEDDFNASVAALNESLAAEVASFALLISSNTTTQAALTSTNALLSSAYSDLNTALSEGLNLESQIIQLQTDLDAAEVTILSLDDPNFDKDQAIADITRLQAELAIAIQAKNSYQTQLGMAQFGAAGVTEALINASVQSALDDLLDGIDLAEAALNNNSNSGATDAQYQALNALYDQAIIDLAALTDQNSVTVAELNAIKADIIAAGQIVGNVLPSGLSQSDVDAIVSDLNQTALDAAYQQGVESITQGEEGSFYNASQMQALLDLAQVNAEAAVSASSFDAGVASVVTVDGLTLAEVEAKLQDVNNTIADYDAQIASLNLVDFSALIDSYTILNNDSTNLQLRLESIVGVLDGSQDSFSNEAISVESAALIQRLESAIGILDQISEISDTDTASLVTLHTDIASLMDKIADVNFSIINQITSAENSVEGASLTSYNNILTADNNTDILSSIQGDFNANSITFLVNTLSNYYNDLLEDYRVLNTSYVSLQGDQNNLVSSVEVEAAEAAAEAALLAKQDAEAALALLYGNDTPQNYIGNGSFNGGNTSGWGAQNATLEITNEKLGPLSGSAITVGYKGSSDTGDLNVTEGKYIFNIKVNKNGLSQSLPLNESISLKIYAGKNDVFETASLDVSIDKTGTSSFVFEVKDLTSDENNYFRVDLGAYNFNYSIDDMSIIKVPETAEYNDSVLEAYVAKLQVASSYISTLNYSNINLLTNEEVSSIYAEGVSSVDITSDNQSVFDTAYEEGAASVTPEDGITQADVDAAVAAVTGADVEERIREVYITMINKLLDSKDASDAYFDDHPGNSMGLSYVYGYSVSDLSDPDKTTLADLKSLIDQIMLDKIDAQDTEVSGLEGEIRTLNATIKQLNNQLEALQAENTVISENANNLQSDVYTLMSVLFETTEALKTQNTSSVSNLIENLNFSAQYGSATGILTDRPFLSFLPAKTTASFSTSVDTITYAPSIYVALSSGDKVYDENNNLIGIVQSNSSSGFSEGTIVFQSNIAVALSSGVHLYDHERDVLITDTVNFEDKFSVGETVLALDNGVPKSVGTIKSIENGPSYDASSNPTERKITFNQPITFRVADNSNLYTNKSLSSFNSTYNTNYSALEEVIVDLKNQIQNLSSVDGNINSTIEAYRFTLFGTPLQKIEGLNNYEERRLLMRNPEVPGYEEWSYENYVVTVVRDDNDYSLTSVIQPILQNHSEFSDEGNLLANTDLDMADANKSSHFHYRVIPNNGGLESVLKLRFLFGNASATRSDYDVEGVGMSISEYGIIDVNNEDVDHGYIFTVSIVRGPSANKWEFALSQQSLVDNIEVSNTPILDTSKVQWEIIEEASEVSTEYKNTGDEIITSDLDRMPFTSTSAGQLNWVIENPENPDYPGWQYYPGGGTYNDPSYFGVESGFDILNNYASGLKNGFDDDNWKESADLKLAVDLEPDTVYEINFEKALELERADSQANPNWVLPSREDWNSIHNFGFGVGSTVFVDNRADYLDFTMPSGDYWMNEEASATEVYIANSAIVGSKFAVNRTKNDDNKRYKTDFAKTRLVAEFSSVPVEYRSIGARFGGGIVVAVRSSDVTVVALNDSLLNYTDTISVGDASEDDTIQFFGYNSDWRWGNGSLLSDSSHSDKFQYEVNIRTDYGRGSDGGYTAIGYGEGVSFNEVVINIQVFFTYRTFPEYTNNTDQRFGGSFLFDFTDAAKSASITTRAEFRDFLIAQINAVDLSTTIAKLGVVADGNVASNSIKNGTQSGFHSIYGNISAPQATKVEAVANGSDVKVVVVSGNDPTDLPGANFDISDTTSQGEIAWTLSSTHTGFVSTNDSVTNSYGLIGTADHGGELFVPIVNDETAVGADKQKYMPFATTYVDRNGEFYSTGITPTSHLYVESSDYSGASGDTTSDNQSIIDEGYAAFPFLGLPALDSAKNYISDVFLYETNKKVDLQISFGYKKSFFASQVLNYKDPDWATFTATPSDDWANNELHHYSESLVRHQAAGNPPMDYLSDPTKIDSWLNSTNNANGTLYWHDHLTIDRPLRIKTSATYDSSNPHSGFIYLRPAGHGFKGKFYGLSIKKVNQVDTDIEGTKGVLSLLGEKIIEGETHNVINQSPVYGTALSNAYNGSRNTYMISKTTGSSDIVPKVAGNYVCVGAYEDKPTDRIYYFVSEEGGDKKRDSILEYDLMTDKVTTVYQDDVKSSDGKSNAILTFNERFLITGVDKVDDILYWTDNNNRPRKINVNLAKANEVNIENPLYGFQDTYFRWKGSTVFVGGDNDHNLKYGDDIYTQYNTTSYLNSAYNGYAKVIGLVPKLNSGVTIAINNGENVATLSSSDHGIKVSSSSDAEEREKFYEKEYLYLCITNSDRFPHYYKIVDVNGVNVTLDRPYDFSSQTNAVSLTFKDISVSGIITNCPWGNSTTSAPGSIFYANPKGAYSPLITFGSYEEKMKYFDVVKHQPTNKPSISMIKDSSVATNNIVDNVFQFKYRYNHFDEEYSAYSPISDVAIDGAYATNAPINASDFNLVKNMIEVSYDDSISDVKSIEIVARKGNDGEFFLIDSIPNNFINHLTKLKNKLIIFPEYEISVEQSNLSFYNNGSYPFIDKIESDKLFDSVPIKAKAQAFLSNNRLAYGNVVEGYDNVDLALNTSFTSEEAPVLETTTENVLFNPTIPDGFRNNADGYDHKRGHGKATFNPTIDFNGINFASDKSQFLELDFNLVFRFDTKYDGKKKYYYRSANFYGAWNVTGISTAKELAEYVQGRVSVGDFRGGIGSGKVANNVNTSSVSASSNSSGKVTIRFVSPVPNSKGGGNIHKTKITFSSRTISGKFTSGTVGVGSFKSGAFHNFGIAYFDETNRCSFVNTSPSYSNLNLFDGNLSNLNGTRAYNPFYTEPGGPDLGQGSKVILDIYNKAPEWAKSYQIYYTGNTTVDEFVQMTVVRAEPGINGSGDDQMYLSLNSLKGKNYSYNQTNNSQVKYNFVPGDRIRFISCLKNGNRVKFSKYIDLEIAGEDLFQGSDSPIGSDEGYYIRINDPINNAVDVILSDESTIETVDISTTGSRNSTSNSGYNGLIVEIYRPKKNIEEDFMVYYEVSDKFPINNGYHNGDSSQAGGFVNVPGKDVRLSEVPATVVINSGDVYLKPRTLFSTESSGNGSNPVTFFPEDYNLNDFHDTNHYSRGRVNVINRASKARRLEASVYYSDPYSSTGSTNGLSSFNLANQPYFDYNKEFGSIQSLQTKDDDLIIFHENKVGRVLVGKDILNTASGDGLVSLSRDIIKNYVTVYSGDYGCCLQPESIVKYDDKFYFMDIKKGSVLRLSNDGITPISDYGMKDYFRDIGEMYVSYDPESQDNQVFNIVAGFDPKYNEYIITLPAVYVQSESRWNTDSVNWNDVFDSFSNKSPNKVFWAKTIAFNEDLDRWTSFYSFYPEFYSKINNQFVGFQAGYLHKHNMTDRLYQDKYSIKDSDRLAKNAYNQYYNYFYNKYSDSSIEFPFNGEPDTVKNYNSISLNSDVKLFTTMTTNIGHKTIGSHSRYSLQKQYEGISTSVGSRRLKGNVEPFSGSILRGAADPNSSEFSSFSEEVSPGDFILVYGRQTPNSRYGYRDFIVERVLSNNAILLNKGGRMDFPSHIEVIDYKKKEGINYAQIPFVPSINSRNTYSSFDHLGDGSELSFAGDLIDLELKKGFIYELNTSNQDFDIVNKLISPNDMVTGGKYVLSSFGGDGFNVDYFGVFDSGTQQKNIEGAIFTCVRPSSMTKTKLVPAEYKVYTKSKNNGAVEFFGYAIPSSNGLKVAVTNLRAAYYFTQGEINHEIFISKEGSIEGERMKGSYMMTTLSTKPDTINYGTDLSKYKFNLYSASVDVDKSELSGE